MKCSAYNVNAWNVTCDIQEKVLQKGKEIDIRCLRKSQRVTRMNRVNEGVLTRKYWVGEKKIMNWNKIFWSCQICEAHEWGAEYQKGVQVGWWGQKSYRYVML